MKNPPANSQDAAAVSSLSVSGLRVFLNTLFLLPQVTTRGEAHLELNAFRRKHDCALVISGDSLEVGSERLTDSSVLTKL